MQLGRFVSTIHFIQKCSLIALGKDHYLEISKESDRHRKHSI